MDFDLHVSGEKVQLNNCIRVVVYANPFDNSVLAVASRPEIHHKSRRSSAVQLFDKHLKSVELQLVY